jgi:penicillin amidase
MVRRRSLVTALVAVGVGSFVAMPRATSLPTTPTASHRAAAHPRPPSERLVARSALPPGESGTFPLADQAAYEANGNPADFGPHVDDQREMYWHNRTKNDGFAKPSGTPVVPRSGVSIYRDSFGVPLIYGKSGYDVWYGAGYAAATDRLFLMDAVRHLAEGRLGELTGASAVPADLQERILTYTHREYRHMFNALPRAGRQAIAGYAAGANARIAQYRTNPATLPGEYQLLTTTPQPWTVEDTMAAGVYITRSIASQGGQEMINVAILRALEAKFGVADGAQIFQYLFPDEEPDAAVTVQDRRFSNLPRGDRTATDQTHDAVRAMTYANRLPLSLALGAGTGNSPAPAARRDRAAPQLSPVVAAEIRKADESIEAWGRDRHGGSFAYAISGSRTKSGHAMVASNPQLDYSYPSELYELEVHGGGYDARGIGVPGIPTVGIGHTRTVAWALTTGYSKTIDSFIETTRKNPKHGRPPQYLHHGRWHNERCRTVHVHYRATGPEGVPVGPPSQTEDAQVCRTVHGPVVATTRNGKRARSVDFAQWMHDDDTVTGILAWDRARTLKQVTAGVRHVRWNENIVAADAKGHIGYWHPGSYFERSPGIDQRFPLKGTGSQDERGLLPFRQMPHVVDPPEGYVANWNTKPAHGWLDGDLSGTNTRPGGPANRVIDLQRQLSARRNFTAASMAKIEERAGEDDHRHVGYRPVLRNLDRHKRGLTAVERKAVRLMLAWDGRAYAPGAKGGSSPRSTPAAQVTDGPAATVFVAFTQQIKRLLFHNVPRLIRARLDTLSTESHQYDVTPLDNDALGVLIPGFSSLNGGVDAKHRIAVERRALAAAVRQMRSTYGKQPSSWRRSHGISHVDSLSGVVGPSTQMPFQDRGTWVQEVAFTTGKPRAKKASFSDEQRLQQRQQLEQPLDLLLRHSR